MPAKTKSKKPQKKPVNKTPVIASPPVPVEEEPVTAVPPVPSTPPPPEVATSEQNLEEMLATEPEDNTNRRKNVVLFGFGAGAAGAIALATIIVFVVYVQSAKAPKTAVPTASATPAVTPTPAFLRSSITFEVLNGSGAAGAALKGATKLTDAGYTVVSTGNAKKQASTQLFITSSLSPTAVSELLGDMQSLFSISSSSGDLLDSKGISRSTASALLILGVK
jgi:hypothetical protein